MIVDSVAYVISLLQVYGVAILLLFVLPMLMWKNYLTNKSLGERFLFCLITQTCYLVNLVLLLGFLGVCNSWTLGAGVAAEFFLIRWTFSDKLFFRRRRADVQLMLRVLRRQETIHQALRIFRAQTAAAVRKPLRWSIWRRLKEHWLELLFLAGVCVYNVLFLNHNVLIYHSYQFSDNPVHLSWVYGLEHGKLFSAGIYPFAMHSMIYVIRALSGIPLREVVLYYGGFQSLMMLICLFLVARRIFSWRYTSWLVVVLFSIMLNQGRYAASLPQECGMFACVSMAWYLIACLNEKREKHIVQGDSKLRSIFRINQYFSRRSLNYNFWMLTLCVALVIAYHFYTAIAAILLALAIVGCYFLRFIKKQYLVPIVTAAVTGALIAVLPFAACFAKGVPFQESMNWAMSVIGGTEWQGTGAGYLESLESDGEWVEGSGQAVEAAEDENAVVSIFKRGLSGKEILQEYGKTMLYYQEAYLFGQKTTVLMLVCAGTGVVAALAFICFRKTRTTGLNYLSILLYLLLIMSFGCFQLLGLVVIFESNRASVFTEPFFFLMLAIPMDAAFCLLALPKRQWWRRVLAAASVVVVAASGVLLVRGGFLHNYFDVNLSYYNEPDFLISRIRNEYPDQAYTVVSPTDEYYAVVEHGFHTELSEFVAMVDGKEEPFKFPTEYVFFFIEKYTLQDYFKGQDFISLEAAQEEFIFRASTQDYYYQRNTIESKAYYWAEAFMKMYPNQMNVYFEDDIYICYVLTQNVNSPLDMRIDYLPETEETV